MLSDNDRKAEFAYGFLHALAATVGAECQVSSRVRDSAGIDATLRWVDPEIGEETTVDVQLKATSRRQRSVELRVQQYNKLCVPLAKWRGRGRWKDWNGPRRTTVAILVVVFVPRNFSAAGMDDLLLGASENCYALCLAGAPRSENRHSCSVPLYESDRLTAESMAGILIRARNLGAGMTTRWERLDG
jgi:hypothetical protein